VDVPRDKNNYLWGFHNDHPGPRLYYFNFLSNEYEHVALVEWQLTSNAEVLVLILISSVLPHHFYTCPTIFDVNKIYKNHREPKQISSVLPHHFYTCPTIFDVNKIYKNHREPKQILRHCKKKMYAGFVREQAAEGCIWT